MGGGMRTFLIVSTIKIKFKKKRKDLFFSGQMIRRKRTQVFYTDLQTMITINFRYIKPYHLRLFARRTLKSRTIISGTEGHCGPPPTPLHCNPHKSWVTVAAGGNSDPISNAFAPGISRVAVISSL